MRSLLLAIFMAFTALCTSSAQALPAKMTAFFICRKTPQPDPLACTMLKTQWWELRFSAIRLIGERLYTLSQEATDPKLAEQARQSYAQLSQALGNPRKPSGVFLNNSGKLLEDALVGKLQKCHGPCSITPVAELKQALGILKNDNTFDQAFLEYLQKVLAQSP